MKEKTKMFKKYLLVILLVCGTVCAGDFGKFERNFKPRTGFKKGPVISSLFTQGNGLWTLKKEKIKLYEVNAVAFINTKMSTITSLCLYVNIYNVDFGKIDTLTVEITNSNKTIEYIKLYKSVHKGFFTISQKQIEKMFNNNVDILAFGVYVDNKCIAGVADINNRIVFDTFFKGIIKQFGSKKA